MATVATRYEFYVLVRSLMFLPREHKIHTFELTCNFLFYYMDNKYAWWRLKSWV